MRAFIDFEDSHPNQWPCLQVETLLLIPGFILFYPSLLLIVGISRYIPIIDARLALAYYDLQRLFNLCIDEYRS
ncbi:hypothetical protein D3C77_334870 [compost metagenome]